MDLKQLEAFAAVMSAGSITGAARLLGRSQPALTRLIQDLETSLGFGLLHRAGPRVTPTEQGLRFHQEVEPVMAWLRQLRERADAIALDRPRSLSVASIASFSVGMLPTALQRLGECVLPQQIHIRTALAEQVVQAVATQVSEIGITSLPVDHPALEIHWIGEAPCVAAVAADDPLAAAERIPLSALAGRRLITMANPFRWRRRVDLALKQRGSRSGVRPGHQHLEHGDHVGARRSRHRHRRAGHRLWHAGGWRRDPAARRADLVLLGRRDAAWTSLDGAHSGADRPDWRDFSRRLFRVS